MEESMELYFAPLACCMSSRIALYEAGVEARYHQVDPMTKRVLSDGGDFLAVTPLGQVPALRTGSGELLIENAAVLQYVADHAGGDLAPAGGIERYRLQQWLSFVGAELHKAVYYPLLDEKASEGARQYARESAERRFSFLSGHLAGREFVLDRFSVADAYLVTVLNWSEAAGIDLAKWPTVDAYYKRLLKRPSVARAVAEERALYAEEVARRKAA
jgi:glutathione S-transferase